MRLPASSTTAPVLLLLWLLNGCGARTSGDAVEDAMAARDFGRAADLLVKTSESRPDDFESTALLAYAQLESRRTQEGRKQLQNARSLSNGKTFSVKLPETVSSSELFAGMESLALLEEGQAEEALSLLSKQDTDRSPWSERKQCLLEWLNGHRPDLFSCFPNINDADDYRLSLLKFWAACHTDVSSAASQYADLIIKKSPDNDTGYRLLAKAKLIEGGKKKYEEALTSIARAIEINSQYWGNHFVRARILKRQGRLPMAIEAMSEAIRQLPSAIWSARLHCARADMYAEEGRFKLAETDYSQAIRLDDRLGPAYLKRAHCRLLLNQNQSALEDANVAVQLMDRSAYAYRLRSIAYHNAEEFELSDSDFATYTELSESEMPGNGDFDERFDQADIALAAF